MSSCEMCGKVSSLVLAELESVDLNVCENCAKYGRIKKRPLELKLSKPTPQRPEYVLVENYPALIRNSREKRQLTQEQFAKFLNEKESLIHKWEAGTLKPDVETARKMERALGLRLVRLEEAIPTVKTSISKEELTLGDFVKVRKRTSY